MEEYGRVHSSFCTADDLDIIGDRYGVEPEERSKSSWLVYLLLSHAFRGDTPTDPNRTRHFKFTDSRRGREILLQESRYVSSGCVAPDLSDLRQFFVDAVEHYQYGIRA